MTVETDPAIGTGSEALASPTVCTAFQATVREHSAKTAIRTQGGALTMSWADYGAEVEALAAGLAGLGLSHGGTVAIQLTNRPEFHSADMAAVHLGAIPFSIYNTSSPEQIQQRLESAGSKIMVTEKVFLENVRAAAVAYGQLEHLIVVDEPGEGELSLDDVKDAASESFDFESTWEAVEPGDLITLIYTSGTTGPPKAAELSHHGVMGTLRALDQVIPMPRDAMVSFMPMAHIAERTWTQYMPLAHGATTTCCPDRMQFLACMSEAHPDTPFMVPRLFDKVRGGIEAKIAAMEDRELAGRLREAIDAGVQRITTEQAGDTADEGIIARHEAGKDLIREVVLEPLGLDRAVAAFVGGAPCPPDIVIYFNALGVPLREGYGMTEVTGFAGVFPRIDQFKVGSVGQALPGVELKLAEDGEILLRSEMNMVGYRNEPEKTAETIDPEGWLHSGDIGEIDEDGYLKIVDRKKDLIINAYGKNMSPLAIEEAIGRESRLAGPIVAVGDGRPYNVALITLDPEVLPLFLKENGIEEAPLADLVNNELIQQEIAGAVERGNERLSKTESIRKFRILPALWAPDTEELTPTMKLKRKPIAQKYEDVLEELYAE